MCRPMPAASEPITFIIPDTTLLGVRAPRPVGGYTETILRVIGVVFGALANADAGPRHGGAVRHDQRLVTRRASQ